MEDIGVLFFGTYLIVMMAVLLFSLAFAVASYILRGLSLSAIAGRRGIPNPWLAWLPFGDVWMIGAISDHYRLVVHGQVRNFRKLLLWLSIALTAVSMAFVPFVWLMSGGTRLGLMYGVSPEVVVTVYLLAFLLYMLFIFALSAASIVVSILQYMALYDLFHSCDPSVSLVYLLVSIFVTYPMPVFLFICRNKDLGMPPVQESLPETA